MTENGGNTWRQASLEEDVILYGAARLTAETACVVGEMGRIFRTRDIGNTWQEIDSPADATLFCISHDGPFMCAAGLDGAIIYSTDSGINWNRAETPGTEALYGISVCGQTAWATGDAGTVLHSKDGGASWHRLGGSPDILPFWLGTVSCRQSRAGDFFGVIGGAKGTTARLENDTIHWQPHFSI